MEPSAKHLPCAFCGDDRPPLIEHDNIVDGEQPTGYDIDNGPVYFAMCQHCAARGPLVGWAADALEAWNTRDTWRSKE